MIKGENIKCKVPTLLKTNQNKKKNQMNADILTAALTLAIINKDIEWFYEYGYIIREGFDMQKFSMALLTDLKITVSHHNWVLKTIYGEDEYKNYLHGINMELIKKFQSEGYTLGEDFSFLEDTIIFHAEMEEKFGHLFKDNPQPIINPFKS